MNIYTEKIRSKQRGNKISSEQVKHSQEYRMLATLRYFFPQEYKEMKLGERPDLQDCSNSVGIEVTLAVREGERKAGSAFAKLREEKDEKRKGKHRKNIESGGYSLIQAPDGTCIMDTTGTGDNKAVFQRSIRKKKEKLQKYRNKFQTLGLGVILDDPPTSEAEDQLVDWTREVFREDDNLFDFVYVLSERFLIYYNVKEENCTKKIISKEEDCSLKKVGNMTAKGELSLEDEEWQ